MKIFNKKYWYVFGIIAFNTFINLNIQTSSATVQTKSPEPLVASDIYDQPVTNLVICNDCSNVIQPTTNNPLGLDALREDLLYALLDNQLVITTTNLFHRLFTIYADLDKDETVLEAYALMQYIIQDDDFDIHTLRTDLPPTLLNLTPNDMEKLTLYAAYNIFLARNYICKEIDTEHLIFIPKNFLSDNKKQATRNRFLKIAQIQDLETLNVSVEDCILGLYISSLKSFDYTKPNFCLQNLKCITPCNPNSLTRTLSTLAIKPRLSGQISLDLLNILLPKMNIYLTGHGSYREMYGKSIQTHDTIAGISCDIMPKQKSGIENILQLLNLHYLTQSFTISSCFAGLNMHNMINELTKQSFFENLSYPILISAGLSTMATTYYDPLVITFKISKANDFLPYFYSINDRLFWGPKKIAGSEGQYTKFFECLNHTETYQVKAHNAEPTYSYSAYQPEYSKAIDVMMGLFNKQDTVAALNNLTLIRFPGTSWTSTAELDTRMQTITPIQGLTAKNGITIPSTVSLTLLSAPYVKYPIHIAKRNHTDPMLWIVPAIINKNLIVDNLPLEYLIEQINCTYDLLHLGNIFFNRMLIKNTTQEFSILIKKAACTNKSSEYTSLYSFESHNNITEYLDVLIVYQYEPSTERHIAKMFYKNPTSKKQTLKIIQYMKSDTNTVEPIITDAHNQDKVLYNEYSTKINQMSQVQPTNMQDKDSESSSQKRSSVLDYNVPLQNKVENLKAAFGKIAKRSLADVQKEQAYRKQKAEAENQSQAQPAQGKMAPAHA